MSSSDQCINCKHFQFMGECEAYPNGIPGKIFTGEHDHEKPFPGDNGIRFEPIEEEIKTKTRRLKNDL